MIVRPLLPHLLALTLGVGAALLVACGGSSTSGGIPQGDASVLKGQIEDVRQRVDEGQCDGLSTQLREIDTAIDGLPRSVDARLVSALRGGSDRLQNTAVSDCNFSRSDKQAKTTTTDTTTTPTDTTTTDTTTIPPETTTTTPPDTTTIPPDTTPVPPTTAPVPPTTTPAPVPPPPVVSPGGGTPPQVP